MRKIILATNVAESSITIPDVTYVVDFCLTKKLNANKETNYVSLQLEWAGETSCWVHPQKSTPIFCSRFPDKDSCKQRRGRCGRVGPGRCIKLVPDWFFNSPDYPAHVSAQIVVIITSLFLDVILETQEQKYQNSSRIRSKTLNVSDIFLTVSK